jgi:hypothetical protein|tara:strand:- start:166 stop:486 length:321 start_codon:yes stop_codon:yes gene_type:complete
MSKNTAAGKHAFGFCDRCGFRFDLSALQWEFEDKRRNGLRVCSPCLDPDHPQLQLGRFRIYDPQTLDSPRPDLSQAESQGLFGWDPVGNVDTSATGHVGQVTVTTT